MADFSGEIQDFERYGTYEYKFDNVGNLTFNSSSTDFSKVYLSMPLRNFVYNNVKIAALNDPVFTEFVPAPKETPVDVDAIQQKVDILETEKQDLQTQLDSLTTEIANDPNIDPEAVKQVILELRKTLGQGRVESDFSEEFPYSPIRKDS